MHYIYIWPFIVMSKPDYQTLTNLSNLTTAILELEIFRTYF